MAFVAYHYRLKLSQTVLAQCAGTNTYGTNALSLCAAARALGFAARGVKGSADALKSVPVPAIAHCLIDKKLLHYVVLVEWTPKFARVMDPVVGRVEKWTHERFKSVWTGVLILMAPDDGFRTGDHTVSPWRRLWRLLRPHRGVLAQALVGAAATTILGLGTAVYVQKIVDDVIPDGNRQLLNLLGVAMLVVLGFKILLGVFQTLLSLRTAQRIDAALILAYYRHLMRLPQSFFDTMRVGEITSRVADAVKIRNFLNNSLLNLLLNPLILGFSLGAMFLWSWQLAVLSLSLVPVNAALYWVVNRFNCVHQRRIMERAADFDAQLVESLNAQPSIRRFRLEEYSELRTEIRLVRLLKTTWDAALAGLATGTTGLLIAQAYMLGLLWFGAGLVLDTGLTPGQLMSCYTLAGYLTGPITQLLGLNTAIQETLIATDRLFEIMDLELEKDQGLIDFGQSGRGEIRFEHVFFKYAGRVGTLEDISLAMPPGRITAVAGESGCGKSTLLSLIQRLYLPVQGRILIGGHDIQYFRLGSLRRQIAVVPQHTHLISGTVLENLTPGDQQPDQERLVRLCRETGALDFIEKLPQGFFTYLSENGANLSGGQRQRLALVRALYVDAPILLLDEPSSALDFGSERMLVHVLRREAELGKIVVLAAHSPGLLATADQIVTLAAGRVSQIKRANLDLQPAAADQGTMAVNVA